MKNIPKEKIDLLNKGEIEARNLMEFLSVDMRLLLSNILPEFNCPELPDELGVTKKHRLISAELNKQFGFKIFEQLQSHKSDTIRTFACYLLGEQRFSFKEKLNLIKALANDSNSGVREWAWIALRNEFAANLEPSIEMLIDWTASSSENLRRFASELSRPRGVWCKHITKLKQTPELGLALLTPLNSDPARYVQLSVGNWLNDAGKDNPEWAMNLCKTWKNNSNTKETAKICKRGLRNL
ncbi:DNA alkylation repair protein [Rickettsiaceae bacterium]|nr:DNA alkylation repair protein [Rickettsiaceae bacterium]